MARNPETPSWQQMILDQHPGLRDIASDPHEGHLSEHLQAEHRLRPDCARFLADYRFKEARAWEFLGKHPKAPRKWRQIGKET